MALGFVSRFFLLLLLLLHHHHLLLLLLFHRLLLLRRRLFSAGPRLLLSPTHPPPGSTPFPFNPPLTHPPTPGSAPSLWSTSHPPHGSAPISSGLPPTPWLRPFPFGLPPHPPAHPPCLLRKRKAEEPHRHPSSADEALRMLSLMVSLINIIELFFGKREIVSNRTQSDHFD